MIVVALLAADGIGAAVGSSSAAGNAGNRLGRPTAADTAFAGPGPYAAGTMQLSLPDGDPVQVWYPASPGSIAGRAPVTASLHSWEPAPAAGAPTLAGLPSAIPTDSYADVPVATDTTSSGGPARGYPVVLVSQGYGSYPLQASYLTDHLASWGFVVASPENRASDLAAVLDGRATDDSTAYVGDLEDTVTLLRAEEHGPTFHGLLDLGEIGIVGASGGGSTAITVAGEPSIKAYVALAPDGGDPPPTDKPGLVVYGTADTVVQASTVQNLYSELRPAKDLVVLQGIDHNPFNTLCDVHDGTGWLTAALAGDTKAPGALGQLAQLAGTHCQTPVTDPSTAWAVVDQAATAELRYGLGVDATPVGLGTGLDHAFPDITVSFYEKS